MASKPSRMRSSGPVTCLIGHGVVVQGDVAFMGALHIDGTVVGNVSVTDDSTGRLTISEDGQVRGNLRVTDAEINGMINGDLHVDGLVLLHGRTHITGNVYYQAIEIQQGARVNGQLIPTHGSTAQRPRG